MNGELVCIVKGIIYKTSTWKRWTVVFSIVCWASLYCLAQADPSPLLLPRKHFSIIDRAGTKVILVNTVIEIFLYKYFSGVFFLSIIHPYTAVQWPRKLMPVFWDGIVGYSCSSSATVCSALRSEEDAQGCALLGLETPRPELTQLLWAPHTSAPLAPREKYIFSCCRTERRQIMKKSWLRLSTLPNFLGDLLRHLYSSTAPPGHVLYVRTPSTSPVQEQVTENVATVNPNLTMNKNLGFFSGLEMTRYCWEYKVKIRLEKSAQQPKPLSLTAGLTTEKSRTLKKCYFRYT